MILISSIKLEQKIAQKALTSWEKTKYIIITTALYSFTTPIYVLTPSFGTKPPIGDALVSFLSSIAAVLITYFGIKKSYLTNKIFDDVHFIERFTILNVPITIKFMMTLLPAFLLLAFFSASLGGDKEIRTEIMSYSMRIMSPIGIFVYYIFLNRSFQRLGLLIKENRES
ncbi:MAG: hypothetical protein Q8K51_07330 [Nitrospirota bacterium]|nr:hypothetical protein [Nitrospirota bacterium]